MKIIGLTKVYNELEKGNLRRCLNTLTKICGKGNLVVCDDSSTDGSLKVIKEYTKHYIVLENDFKAELAHKQKILEMALTLNPDWLLFLDGDESLERFTLEEIPNLCSFGDQFGYDCFNFHLINLWGSKCWYRIDNHFNDLWKIILWKNTGNLKFDIVNELHRPSHPKGLTKFYNSNLNIIHFGFSSLDLILRKIVTYEKFQKGWELARLYPTNKNMELKPINLQLFPPEERPKMEPAPKPISEEKFQKLLKEGREKYV